MADEKMNNLAFAGTPVSRSSFRERKKEKFKRHLANLGSPTNGANHSNDSTALSFDARDPSSPKSATTTKPKTKPAKTSAIKARAPPAGFRSLQHRTPTTTTASNTTNDKTNGSPSTTTASTALLTASPSDDSESYGGRFPKRQIRYVATSPSEDSESASYLISRRPIRSIVTNPSEDSMESKKVTVPLKLPTVAHGVKNSTRSEDNNGSEASAPTEVQANKSSSAKAASLRRISQRSRSVSQSDVDIPFDEVIATQSLDMSKAEARSLSKHEAEKRDESTEQKPLRKSASLSRLQVLSKRSHSADKTHEMPKESTHRVLSNLAGRSRSLTRSRSAHLTGLRQTTTDKTTLAPSRSLSRGRKSKLVEMMASRKAAALRAESKEPVADSYIDNNAQQDVAEPSLDTERKPSSSHMDGSQPTDSKVELHIDPDAEIFPDPTIEDIQIYESGEDVEGSHAVEQKTIADLDTLESTLIVELNQDNLVEHDNNFEEYEDPPLEELESEVSAGGFDMGSIHDYLPSDSHQRTTYSETQEESKAWASSNVVFEHDNDEKKEESYAVFDAFSFDNTGIEEKKEKEEVETVVETNDASWDAATFPFANAANSLRPPQSTGDKMDMFDTSSWAAGTEARFSDVSLSRLAANVDSEKQFVTLMMEEMKTRALTDDESKMLFEAQRNIEKAEETVRVEAKQVKMEDFPLMGSKSSSDVDRITDGALSLDERLKAYEATGIVDEDSIVESIAESESGSDDAMDVQYVDQDDVEDYQDDCSGNVLSQNLELNETVPAQNAAALDIEQLKSASLGAEIQMPRSGYESIQMAMVSLPPPPPPGQPKKKKRNKSKPGSNKSIPLIAPPPEEKIKLWEENRARAQNYIASMNERLEKEDIRTLDEAFNDMSPQSNREKGFDSPQMEHASSEEGIPKTVLSHNGAGDIAFPVNNDPQDDLPEINMFLSGLSEDEIQQSDVVVETPECAESSEQNISVRSGEKSIDGVEEEQILESQSPPALNFLDAAQSAVMDGAHVQLSLFSSAGSVPGNTKLSKVFHDKTGDTKQAHIVLVDQSIADKVALASSAAAQSFEETYCPINTRSSSSPRLGEAQRDCLELSEPSDILCWFSKAVLNKEITHKSLDDVASTADSLLRDRENFNSLCEFVADNVNYVTTLLRPDVGLSESLLSSFDESTVVSAEQTLASADEHAEALLENKRPWMRPIFLPESGSNISPLVLAANYVSFFYMASKLSKVTTPFGDSNPFLAMVVEASLTQHREDKNAKTPQELLFAQLDGRADLLLAFVYHVKRSCDAEENEIKGGGIDDVARQSLEHIINVTKHEEQSASSRRFIVPCCHPSPFEASVWEAPRIVAVVLSFLGDPVAVCRMKMVNRFCCRVVVDNEHILMQNAVRTGGIEMSVRPAFWMYVTLQKCDRSDGEGIYHGTEDLRSMARQGEDGKWHSVIERDVARSFGNMPPHKTGARLRNDSIVRALVTYGHTRIMKRGVKGGGEPFPTPEIGPKDARKPKSRPTSPTFATPWEGKEDEEEGSVTSDVSETPTDRVSDWGGVSPKGSFTGSVNDVDYDEEQVSNSAVEVSMDELALSGNSLTADAKDDLRNKLSFILHCLAVTHRDIGYCQGMDYVVAHLLRILQETVKWKAANKCLVNGISTAASIDGSSFHPITPGNYQNIYKQIDDNLVVEEVVLRVMDTLFLHYNLRHMYWPELRCLKTCCRVFERLIQIKLPVLADHFEHHDLNVGLFALGWFQTLFLYLPSMPSATVCHMWDIWLVERSFKIFFRVGTAILFLSQPTLLNHELEGMMTYLNTIPDATLLRPDILIPCALNIKVTNKMLQELEAEVMKQP